MTVEHLSVPAEGLKEEELLPPRPGQTAEGGWNLKITIKNNVSIKTTNNT